jgi:membrane protein DedA with SNARE-associated domain
VGTGFALPSLQPHNSHHPTPPLRYLTNPLPTIPRLRYADGAARNGTGAVRTGPLMLQHFNEYGYQGVFFALIAAGFGFPIPEELPVITAGVLVGHEDTTLKWYIMLPVVMAGVVLGDGILYAIGRIWGHKLLDLRWVQRNFVPPEKRHEIEKNIADKGIMVLLGARLLPGIRTPIFIMAGVLRVPVGRFLFADLIYAIPLVNVLFWLSYMLTDQMLVLFNKVNEYRSLVAVAILSGVAGALVQKYILSRHVSTGEPPHVPKIISKPAGAVAHAIESAVEKVTGRHHQNEKEAADRGHEVGGKRPETGDRRPDADSATAAPTASADGAARRASD